MIIHLTEDYAEDTKDLSHGKYENGMAKYLDLKEDFDNSTSTSEGEGACQFGKRVVWWDDRGFVNCSTFATVELAEKAMPKFCSYVLSGLVTEHGIVDDNLCNDVAILHCADGTHYCIEHAWYAEQENKTVVPWDT